MKNEIKNYVLYFLRKNIKYIILEFIVLFLVLPFMVYTSQTNFNNQQVYSNLYSNQYLVSKFAQTMIFCIFILSLVTPIMVYRFQFKRKQCDLYFSLPIKRGNLFTIQYIIGLIIALVPFTINVILASIVCSLHYSEQAVNPLFPYILLVYILFFALYSFVTFIISKCNTVLDACIVSIGFIFVPFAINIATQNFLSTQISNIFTSDFSGTDILGFLRIMDFISPIICGGNYVSKYLMDISYDSIKVLIAPTVYWLVVAIVLMYLARRSFISRREEDSEHKTTNVLTYPLLIILVSVTIIIGTFKINYISLGMLFNILIVFVLYAVLTFIQERKICIKWRGLSFFAFVYALSIGFTVCFQNSEGFGLIHEVPKTSEIETVRLSIRMLNEEEETSYEYDAEGNPYYTVERILIDKDQIQQMVSLQEDLIEIGRESGPIEVQDGDSISIRYIMKNGDEIYRYYPIYNSSVKEIAHQIVKWIG